MNSRPFQCEMSKLAPYSCIYVNTASSIFHLLFGNVSFTLYTWRIELFRISRQFQDVCRDNSLGVSRVRQDADDTRQMRRFRHDDTRNGVV
jgi:hypothetical protein